MLNYFRSSAGQMRPRQSNHEPLDPTFQTEVFFFDDEDPEDMRAALAMARDAFDQPRVNVWRSAPTVPSSVHEIGWLPPRTPDDVLLPGMATATRAHSTGLVGENGRAA